jgi:hypothetical protein
VAAVSKYKDGKPSQSTVVFSKAKGTTVDIFLSGSEREYQVAQSTILKKEGDYQIDLFESFSLHFDRNRLLSLTLTVAQDLGFY